MGAKKIPSPNMADALMICSMVRGKPKKPAASRPSRWRRRSGAHAEVSALVQNR
jgi:hypothetical protein